MIEIKPSKQRNIVMLITAIPVVFLLYYVSKDIYFSGLALVLVLVGTALNSRSRISLNNGIVTSVSILGKNSISIENIESIKLRSGAKQIILVLFSKKDGQGKVKLVRVYNISLFKREDLIHLLNEVIRLNPVINISNQVKNLMEGKLYYTSSFEDS